MHSNFLATVLIAISVANGIFAVPLHISPNATSKTKEEKENGKRLDEANAEANNQIPHMEKVLADPTNEKHKPLIEAAFGKDPSLDLNKVKENVQKLKMGAVKVDLKTAPTTKQMRDDKTLAWTNYNKGVPVDIKFVKKFHQSAKSTRAGTLIHEATHFLGDTTDYAVNGQMLNGGQELPENAVAVYTDKPNMYKTPKALNGNTYWANVRDSTRNMHNSAEAYNQFASLCANAKLSRRDYHNFRRALATGDDDSAIAFLAKRNACALPKDYFKKKAAEKAAAAKKGAAEKKPAAGAAKSKGPAAKTLAKSKTTPHAGKQSPMKKSPIAGKAATKKLPGGRTAKAVGKAAGSKRPTKTKTPAAAAHGGKHAATPKSKAAGSTAGGKKKGTAAGRRVTKTTANKGALKSSIKRPTTKAAGTSKNRLTKVNASKRPTSKASGHTTGNRVLKPKSAAAAAKRPNTKAAGKKAVKSAARSTTHKPARKTTQKKSKSPAAKFASKAGLTKANVASSKSAPRKAAVSQKKAVVANKTAPKVVAAKPKPVAKAAPKKTTIKPAPAKPAAGKKGRRDLEFESEFDV
ncbi:hypothetical protein D9613_010292 [Agrocybe pediades]|uniref:Lysine-specific metallo-endopeptidase domain-containing protein n=1 Tax=Agrocybe pediades TaxID=84607 RepID=A0A8H4VJD5_9AGAR|nr:hypothetical protein D9613_010292 [Agrocybe pediades]